MKFRVGTVLALASGAYLVIRSARKKRLAQYHEAVTVLANNENILTQLADPTVIEAILPGHLEVIPTTEGLEIYSELFSRGFGVDVRELDEIDGFEWNATLPFATLGGTVELLPAPGNRGTELHAFVFFRPKGPLPKPGLLDREAVEGATRVALGRLRALLETGETPTTEGQPSGRIEDIRRLETEPVRGLPIPPESEELERRETGS